MQAFLKFFLNKLFYLIFFNANIFGLQFAFLNFCLPIILGNFVSVIFTQMRTYTYKKKPTKLKLEPSEAMHQDNVKIFFFFLFFPYLYYKDNTSIRHNLRKKSDSRTSERFQYLCRDVYLYFQNVNDKQGEFCYSFNYFLLKMHHSSFKK